MPARPLIVFFILLVIVICALIYNKVKNRVDETFDNDGNFIEDEDEHDSKG